jgi:dihydrofolate synthase/folylpolyglutamate synthase
MTDKKSYRQTIDALDALPKMRPQWTNPSEKLEASRKLFESFDVLAPSSKLIHVAGTSGKGTVCYTLDAALRFYGKTTVMLVSPHIYELRERIQSNGSCISEADFVKYFWKIIDSAQELSHPPGYFEMLLAIGLLNAKYLQPDYLIVETGLGGTFDSSNALVQDNKIAIITPIGLDHQKILGDTISEIATQKAGIIKNRSAVFASPQVPDALRAIEKRAKECSTKPTLIHDGVSWQQENKKLVDMVLSYLHNRDNWEFALKDGVDDLNINIPGRFEQYRLDDTTTVILDGAHNTQKVSALIGRLKTISMDKFDVIFAAKQGKDIQSMLRLLLPVTRRLYVVEFYESQDTTSKAERADHIITIAKKLGFDQVKYLPTDKIKTVNSGSNILVTGSFMHLKTVRDALSFRTNATASKY